MAELRKIVRRDPLSNFQQVAPSGGGMFRALAEAADVAYQMLEPAAKQEAAQRGTELGKKIAGGQIGPPGVSMSTSGVSASLGQTESGGNYQAQNSEGFTGKYQWGQARLDDYNKANGTAFTLAEFKASPDLQEKAQAWHEADIMQSLGGYVGQVVNGITMTPGAIIGMAHLGGIGGARKFIETGGAYNPSDSNGTSLSDYAKTHGGAAATAPAPPTMLRKADGSLEARLYSPMSGPILQAYNAAAGMAYVQDVSLKGLTDIMGISEQFLLDPTGFQQAATSYVDSIIKDAPAPFRADLRSSLEKEVQRRVVGIMADRQDDIRQRATNGNTALMQRKTDELASAIAGGNPDEIAAAQDELDGILAARERIPGLAWTPEQSQNEIIRARQSGAAIVKEQQTKQKAEAKTKLQTIKEAAQTGMTAADETILDDPMIRALLPDEWNATASAVMLRDARPEIGSMTPKQLAGEVASAKAVPVTGGFQVDMVKSLEDFASKHAAAFSKDPIGAAMTFFPEDKRPAPLPALDPSNPQAYLAALQERAIFARGLVASGHTDAFTLLSEAEAKAASAIFAKDVPADLKAVAAGQVVAALGDDAATFFKNAGANDPILKHAGMLMARGGSEQVAVEAMRGAEMLATGQAQKPTRATSIGQVDPDIASALAFLPPQQQRDVMDTAIAIAAARNPSTSDPTSDEAKGVMKEAIQSALGQSADIQGRKTGGTQPVGDRPVLLPPGMSGEVLSSALDKAFEPDMTFGQSIFALGEIGMKPDVWAKAGGVPTLGGKPIDPFLWSRGDIVLTPVGGNNYRMSVDINGQTIDVRMGDDPNAPFVFDAQKLIEAAQ